LNGWKKAGPPKKPLLFSSCKQANRKLPCVKDWLQDVKRKDGRPCVLYLLALNKIVSGLHTTVNIEDSHSWVTVTPEPFPTLNFGQKLTKKKAACS